MMIPHFRITLHHTLSASIGFIFLVIRDPILADTITVEVTGVLNYRTSPLRDSEEPREFRRNFSVVTDGFHWRITSRDPLNADPQLLYWEIGFDGRFTYHVTAYDTNYDGPGVLQIPQRERPPIEKPIIAIKALNTAVGIVADADIPIPYEGFSMSPIIWFAYASGATLNHTAFLPPIFHSFPSFSEAIRLPATVQVEGQAPFLPSHAVFMNPGFLFGMSAAVPTTLKLNASYTNAVFRVVSFTNVHEWRLPLRFEFTSYKADVADLSQTNFQTKQEYRVVGLTESVVVTTNSFVPNVPIKTLFVDLRPASRSDRRPPILISNDWPTIDESLQLQNPGNSTRSPLTRLKRVERTEAFLRMAGITILFSAAATWLWHRGQRANEKNRNK